MSSDKTTGYYKSNAKLAEAFGVSEGAVRNWIKSAEAGKLDLELFQQDGRYYIANAAKNQVLLKQLAERGKKYRNSNQHIVVSPLAEFYELFTPAQVIDIAASIDTHRELPLKYDYFNGGAKLWDERVTYLLSETEHGGIAQGSIHLLELSQQYLSELTSGSRRINVIDLGPGNALPIKGLLGWLLSKGSLGRYVAIDLSPDILDIARHNLHEWFGDKVPVECYQRDLESEQFDDLIAAEQFTHAEEKAVNLVLLLGGTATNFRDSTETQRLIARSMGKNDLLIYTDADLSHSDLHFPLQTEKLVALEPMQRLLPKWLNISPELYELEQFRNNTQRHLAIRFKKSISLNFALKGNERQVEIERGERLVVWRRTYHDIHSLAQNLSDSNFQLRHAGTTSDGGYYLAIASLKRPDN